MNAEIICIIDPDESFSKQLKVYFESHGFNCLCFESEQTLKAQTIDQPIGLVFSHKLVAKPYQSKSYAERRLPLFEVMTDKSISHPYQFDKSQQAGIEPQLFYWLQVMQARAHYELLMNASLNFDGMSATVTPTSLLEGYGAFVETSPDQDQHLLITGFQPAGVMGQTLQMITHQVFSSMAQKGFAFDQIIREMAFKAKTIFPSHVRSHLAYVKFDHHSDEIMVWNCMGKPLHFFQKSTQTLVNCPSMAGMNEGTEHSLFKLSDIDDWELLFEVGPQLPQEKLLKGFVDGQHMHHPHSKFSVFVQPEQFCQLREKKSAIVCYKQGPIDLDIQFNLNANALKHWDPLPVVMHVLMENQVLHQRRADIFVTLTELYNNALEHGVLGLKSSMKNCTKGIQSYYEEKRKRLNDLEEGHIMIHAKVSHIDGAEHLVIDIKDSGDGFLPDEHVAENKYSGRGIGLIKALCTNLEFLNTGNHVVAQMSLSRPNH